MKQVQTVSPQHVHQVWDSVKHFFEAAIGDSTDYYTIDQLRNALAKGEQDLLVFTDNNELIGALTVHVHNEPNHRVAHLTIIGGKGVVESEIITQVEAWAKLQGATKIRAWAKEPQARLYRQRMNLNTTMLVVEKTI
jgi:hypothetical protein